MTNRTLIALSHAQDVANQEADLWRARQVREAADGEFDISIQHSLRAEWCSDASKAINDLRDVLTDRSLFMSNEVKKNASSNH